MSAFAMCSLLQYILYRVQLSDISLRFQHMRCTPKVCNAEIKIAKSTYHMLLFSLCTLAIVTRVANSH